MHTNDSTHKGERSVIDVIVACNRHTLSHRQRDNNDLFVRICWCRCRASLPLSVCACRVECRLSILPFNLWIHRKTNRFGWHSTCCRCHRHNLRAHIRIELRTYCWQKVAKLPENSSAATTTNRTQKSEYVLKNFCRSVLCLTMSELCLPLLLCARGVAHAFAPYAVWHSALRFSCTQRNRVIKVYSSSQRGREGDTASREKTIYINRQIKYQQVFFSVHSSSSSSCSRIRVYCFLHSQTKFTLFYSFLLPPPSPPPSPSVVRLRADLKHGGGGNGSRSAPCGATTIAGSGFFSSASSLICCFCLMCIYYFHSISIHAFVVNLIEKYVNVIGKTTAFSKL